ncbi:MAG TPA: XRE family transcriptional regulator [Pseudonocardia sp.]|nr:XRE family transcriptional regulator [Pseudonocardia sp.]
MPVEDRAGDSANGSAADESATEQWVGRRLREARRQRDLTLASVAARVGVSGAHLSRLEKGERQPSIGVLLELARAYQTSIGELLGEHPRRGHHLVRAGEGPSVDGPDGPYTSVSGLGPGAALRAVRLVLPPGGTNPNAAQHAGEEWIYVVAGDVTVALDSERLSLSAGDALHFDAGTPHRLTNPGPAEAEVLIVSTSAATGH